MAYYHNNLKYHEDKTEKHRITQEEAGFLCELQKEMNTQDTLSQAEPRFWVIKGSEERVVADGYGDSCVLFDEDAAETVARTMQQAYEYIKEKSIEELKEIEMVEPDGFIKVKYDERCFGEDEEELTCMEDVRDFLNGFNDKYITINYEKADKIYPDTMFLTQKEAENHLRANDYHYSKDAHTYAMTAWRSPDVEKLWKILREVDWENVAKLIEKDQESF